MIVAGVGAGGRPGQARQASKMRSACADAIRGLYADIGFADRFMPDQLPRQRVREMAERAVPGLYAGIAAEGFDTASVNDDTVIASPAARKMTVRQAERMFESCLA